MRLLLLDDDANYSRSLRRVIQRHCPHWDCHTSNSVQEANAILRNVEFDLIVSDLEMPGGNGDIFFDALLQVAPEIVRILHSGNLDRGKALAESGCCHQFIAKPCRGSVLLQTLRTFEEILYLEQSSALKSLLLKASSLPREPTLAVTIDALLASEDFHQNDIVELLSRDPVVTGLLLRAAQNVAFSAAAPVQSLEQAIVKLGTRSIRNLVLGAELFSRVNSDERLNLCLAKMWDHCFEVAELSRRLAAIRGANAELQDMIFTTGILHDLGMLLILEADKEHYVPLLESGTEAEIIVFEQEEYGIDHARLGAMLIKRWGLASEIAHAISLHHSSPSISTNALSATCLYLVENVLSESSAQTQEQKLETMGTEISLYYD